MQIRAILIFLFVSAISTTAEVDESTGRMVLNERLATVSGNTISFNLDLQYSSGITVDQRASWVGLGFDISLPYIDRIPIGSVDEKPDTFMCDGPGFYSTKYYRKLLSDTGNGYTVNPDTGWFTSQQDIYSLNADFANGRIVFAQPQDSTVRMKAYLQNWRPLIVDYQIDSTDNINKWVIVTEDGTRYVFGQPVKARKNENTGQTWFGTDSTWDEISIWHTGMPGWWSTAQVKSEDKYVNETFNRRWYLTEIQSVNYDTATGQGERIVLSYTAHNESYQVLIADLNKYVDEYNRAATGLFSYTNGGHKHVNITFTNDNYYIHPIYPVEITSPTGKICFVMSSNLTYDKLSQGNKRIDKIEVYSKRDTSFILASQILMNYDTIGLAQGHPYSSGGKGLLRLNSVERLSANGLDTLPIVAFEYTANPSFYPPSCYYKHDFYGFYRSTELRRSGGSFTYPAGQSDTGNVSSPGAEAWSVKKIHTGEGKASEYQYEPGIATKISTNEEVASSVSPLKIGIRVKMETISGGDSMTEIVNTFEYGTGYIDHNFALRHGKDSLYALINRGEFSQVGNVMVLKGAAPCYDHCIRSTSGDGSVKTHFVNPSSVLPIYQSIPADTLCMADVYLTDSMSVNSLAHFRGLSWKSEYFKPGTTSNPVQSMIADYAIKYDFYRYNTPEVVSLPLATCAVGGGSGDADMPEMADNQNQSDFIGFLRLISTEETRDGVTMLNEVLSYNSTNGLPSKTRVTNSDGKQKLTCITYAIEEKKPDQTLVYQAMKDANMLSQQTETVVYEKAPGDGNTGVLSANVCSAQTITYSNVLGSYGWAPWQVYSWKANFLSSGSPDKTFADFNHVAGASNPNWQLMNTTDMMGQQGNILQISKPSQATDVTVFRNDNVLPIGVIRGGSFYECGVFTGDYTDGKSPHYWDYANGWEKGATNTVELVGGVNAHFGEKAIHVIQDYAAGRNNRVYPGKAYTMSAWVKVDSGTIKMATDFRYANSGHESDWPATQVTTASTPGAILATPVTATECNGQWKLMTMEIPASITSQLDPAKVWYARAWVGNDPTAPRFKAYVDDVLFYPSDALVTTRFYDTKWRKPALVVDANNNPGQKIIYDSFGRPIEWRKIDKQNPALTQLVQSREYHLMWEN